MDFHSLPGPGAFLVVAALILAILATLAAVGLKLLGVLLLSWWMVLSPLPVLLVVIVFIAGLMAIFR